MSRSDIRAKGPKLTLGSIIAVHGLAANPLWTWIKTVSDNEEATGDTRRKIGRLNEQGEREVMWLTDLLPTVVPNARVFKYSYASNYLMNAPKENLRSIACRLVRVIHGLRSSEVETIKRPTIFIGHSFGGIVIEEV